MTNSLSAQEKCIYKMNQKVPISALFENKKVIDLHLQNGLDKNEYTSDLEAYLQREKHVFVYARYTYVVYFLYL